MRHRSRLSSSSMFFPLFILSATPGRPLRQEDGHAGRWPLGRGRRARRGWLRRRGRLQRRERRPRRRNPPRRGHAAPPGVGQSRIVEGAPKPRRIEGMAVPERQRCAGMWGARDREELRRTRRPGRGASPVGLESEWPSAGGHCQRQRCRRQAVRRAHRPRVRGRRQAGDAPGCARALSRGRVVGVGGDVGFLCDRAYSGREKIGSGICWPNRCR